MLKRTRPASIEEAILAGIGPRACAGLANLIALEIIGMGRSRLGFLKHDLMYKD